MSWAAPACQAGSAASASVTISRTVVPIWVTSGKETRGSKTQFVMCGRPAVFGQTIVRSRMINRSYNYPSNVANPTDYWTYLVG